MVTDATDGEQPAGERRLRRSRLAGGVRSKMVGVRVTPGEYARLVDRAQDRDTTVPGLLLSAALGDAVEAADQVAERRRLGVELMRVQRLVGGTADNMNQIAKKANTVHEVPSTFGPAMAQARSVWDRCGEILDQLVTLNRRAGA